MIELGQLEKKHAEFDRRESRVVVISLEDRETAALTQADFPHLTVVADADRNVAESLQVIQPQSAPGGGDTTAPTTILVDGGGIVRWVFRPARFVTRLSPAQVLTELDERVQKNK
jgi:peroxiredoxin